MTTPSCSAPVAERFVGTVGLLLVLVALLLPGPHDRAVAEPSVLLVRGDFLGENGLPNQPKAAAAYEAAAGLLRQLNLAYTPYADSRVEEEGLPAAALAVFPYNRAMTEREATAVVGFMAAGGKVVVCFAGHPRVLAALGVSHQGWCPGAGPAARLLVQADWPGCPARVAWPAAQRARLAPGAGGQTAAVWQGTTPAPAIVGNAAGLFIGALPCRSDSRQLPLWRAALGELVPGLWEQMLVTDPAALPGRGRFASFAELRAYLQAAGTQVPGLAPACEQAQLATDLLGQARTALAGGQVPAALEAVTRARQAAESAYWQSYPPVPGELRGAWMCNYAEPSWPEATRALAAGGFNTVFPYMMSGGIAFYRSRALPRHPDVASHGDYLAEAVAAGRAAGISVHTRMLNMSCLFAPAEVKQALAAQGRLMRSAGGKTYDWLCPTNERNRRTEVAAALEMLAYGVQGLQFDYLRYPSASTCYCAACRRKFEADEGLTVARWPEDAAEGCYRGRFADWRREQLTSLVAELSQAVKRARPTALVSAAVFLNWEDHRETFGQDWKVWTDRHLVDFVCPMDYTTDPERFDLYVSRQERWIGGKVPYAAGIGVYADGFHFRGPEQVLEQIRVAREHGSQGFVIFNYQPRLVTDYLPWLRLGVTREPTEFRVGAAE